MRRRCFEIYTNFDYSLFSYTEPNTYLLIFSSSLFLLVFFSFLQWSFFVVKDVRIFTSKTLHRRFSCYASLRLLLRLIDLLILNLCSAVKQTYN